MFEADHLEVIILLTTTHLDDPQLDVNGRVLLNDIISRARKMASELPDSPQNLLSKLVVGVAKE
jgi:hypothetical protein